eukprot:313146_1
MNSKPKIVKSKELQRNSHVSLIKGRGYRYYNTENKEIKIWVEDRDFQAGDIAVFGCKGWNGNQYSYENAMIVQNIWNGYEYWAMCMKQHKSNKDNKLEMDQIFEDLVINLIPDIRLILVDHVSGFLELSQIIINYCYSTNKFWWIGCHTEKEINQYKTNRKLLCHINHMRERCGNLSVGISSSQCKLCLFKTKTLNKDIMNGSIIKLDKNSGNVSRIINKKSDIKIINNYENVILKKQITSNSQIEQIYNLLSRNFNNEMNGLIECCMNKQNIFKYMNSNHEIVIDIGNNINLWALYSNTNELLCALIWRSVDGVYTTKSWKWSSSEGSEITILPHNFVMFETLFLSTFENVRYEHYGYEMVKRIELYARSNCIDILSVAAVPGHGVKFWSKNGFEEIYDNKKCLNKSLKRYGNDDKTDNVVAKQFDAWILNNMLVFEDTPLFVKYLS